MGRLFRVRKTITNMLVDRGYLISTEAQNTTLAQFKEQFGLNPTCAVIASPQSLTPAIAVATR